MHSHKMSSAFGAASIIYDRLASTDYWALLAPLDCPPFIRFLGDVLRRVSHSEAFTIENVGAIVFVNKTRIGSREIASLQKKHGALEPIPVFGDDADILAPQTELGLDLMIGIIGAFQAGEDIAVRKSAQ